MFEHSNDYLLENENEIKVSDTFYYVIGFSVLSLVLIIVSIIF